MHSNTNTLSTNAQLEYSSFWNPELPTSFAPDFMGSDMTMTSSIDTSMSILEDPTFDFNLGRVSNLRQTACGGIDTMPSDVQDPFYAPFQQQHAADSIPLKDMTTAPETWTTQLSSEADSMLNTASSNPYGFCDAQQGVSVTKRPFHTESHDYPSPKRQMVSPYKGDSLTSDFFTAQIEGNTPIQETPQSQSSQFSSALNEDAADICSTWFSKRYSVFPSDKDIAALGHLTRMPASSIRSWFGDFLAKGLSSENDSAYISQDPHGDCAIQSDSQHADRSQELNGDTTMDTEDFTNTDEYNWTETVAPKDSRTIGKKSCVRTLNPDLLCRDESRIYQCTRKCGKRYVRKCDWKRNEQEGYPSKHWLCSLCLTLGLERTKPCYRRYHFTQHFSNIHPTVSAAHYEADSLVETETTFPRRCGFCPSIFSSRQERIDHIANHFKQGKCMLDWDDDTQGDGHSPNDDSGDDDTLGDGGSAEDDFDNQRSTDNTQLFRGGKDRSTHGSATDCKGGYDTDENGQSGRGSQATWNSQAVWTNSGGSADIGCTERKRHHPNLPTAGQGAQQKSAISTYLSSEGPTEPLTPSEAAATVVHHFPLLDDDSSQVGIYPLSIFSTAIIDLACGDQTSRESPAILDSGETLLTKRGLHDCTRSPDYRGCPNLSSKDYHPRFCSVNAEIVNLSARIDCECPTPGSLRAPGKPCPQNQISALSISQPEILKNVVNSLGNPRYTSKSFLSVRFLGMGGFSTVDEVLHRETGLRMCRKTIRAQQKMLAQSLTQEVEILQQLRHPHIIRLLESYSQGDKLSILLSPVADMTLAVWLEQYPAKPPVGGKDTILQMFGCLTSSVRYLHEQRPLVAHTDIKPQNILIIQGPNKYPHVILNDFGISRASKDHHSELDFGPMTPRYCAPEVADHTSRGPEADIWSLGCVFMEMALVVREKEDNLHQSFRKEFSGRNFYYKDIARVHRWLDRLRETNASCKELLVLETIKAMLGTMPEERPDANSLALVFTPGSCCIAWPSITQHFPGPLEEAKAYEDLLGHAAPFDGAVIAVSMLESPKHAVRFPNALDWMQTCATHHHFCQPPALESQHAGILPARFLEVHPTDSEEYSGHVVSASNLPPTTPYAALSYVWNDDDMLLNSDNIDALYSSVPLDALSKPVSDAISVTRKLGLRYLWVDTLCIVQDSESDRRDECAAMTDLYRNATVTIAAIHGGFSPEHGVTHTNDDHNTYLRPDALWDTRAWSQQERLLSKRTLYLTDSQWYWECPSLRASDTLPKGLPSLLWESIHCNEKHHTVQGLV